MKIINLLIASALLIPASGCAKSPVVIANGNYVTREVKVKTVEAIKTSSCIDVEYTQSPVTKVTVTAPDNVIDLIAVEMSGTTLRVDLKGKVMKFGKNTCVRVSAPSVTDFSASSSGDIKIIGDLRAEGSVTMSSSSSGDIDAKKVECAVLNLSASSSGDIEVDNALCQQVYAKASSSGDIEIGGKCEKAALSASSSGDIKAKRLIAVDVVASASSSGDISCSGQNVDVKKSSAGDVKVNKLNR